MRVAGGSSGDEKGFCFQVALGVFFNLLFSLRVALIFAFDFIICTVLPTPGSCVFAGTFYAVSLNKKEQHRNRCAFYR
ncbi:MAG: hypothetical protein RugAbin2_00116 [Rugosibacter sp.]|nr:hypothetical protein [Rugosibacter sp.]